MSVTECRQTGIKYETLVYQIYHVVIEKPITFDVMLHQLALCVSVMTYQFNHILFNERPIWDFSVLSRAQSLTPPL